MADKDPLQFDAKKHVVLTHVHDMPRIKIPRNNDILRSGLSSIKVKILSYVCFLTYRALGASKVSWV